MKTTMRSSMLASAALLALLVSGSAQAQQANMTFFVTSAGSGKGGDLGGLAGADAHCQALATAAGAGAGKTWHAYLSTNAAAPGGAVNARDRIGKGPWQNAKGVVIATSVDDLHSDNNKISKETGLTEKGDVVKGVGDTPNQHDMLTGSDIRWQGLRRQPQPDLQQLDQQQFRLRHARPLRPQGQRRYGVPAFLGLGAHVARLHPARSGRHRRRRPVLLLRRQLRRRDFEREVVGAGLVPPFLVAGLARRATTRVAPTNEPIPSTLVEAHD